jgi:transposase-like protein
MKLKRLLATVKLFLWRLGLLPDRCPFCGSRLVAVGFPYDVGFQDYVCPRRDCEFNKKHK